MKYLVLFVLLIFPAVVFSADIRPELISSIKTKNIDSLLFLLSESISDVNLSPEKYYEPTPASAAVEVDSPEILSILAMHGADLNIRITQRLSLLQLAVTNEKLKALKYLLGQNPDPDLVSQALRNAIYFDKQEAVRVIVNDPSASKIISDSTLPFYPLTVRTPPKTPRSRYNPKTNRLEIIQMLKALKLDMRVPNKEGKTAADLAAEHKDIEALKLLDIDKRYADLIKFFSPSDESKIIGDWTNRESGFKGFAAYFKPKGKGGVFLSIATIPMTWGQDKNRIEVVFEPDPNIGKNDLTFEYDAQSDTIIVNSPSKKQKIVLYRK